MSRKACSLRQFPNPHAIKQLPDPDELSVDADVDEDDDPSELSQGTRSGRVV